MRQTSTGHWVFTYDDRAPIQEAIANLADGFDKQQLQALISNSDNRLISWDPAADGKYTDAGDHRQYNFNSADNYTLERADRTALGYERTERRSGEAVPVVQTSGIYQTYGGPIDLLALSEEKRLEVTRELAAKRGIAYNGKIERLTAGEVLQAAGEGISDGAVIVSDRLTMGKIQSLHAKAENLIETNGGLYHGSALMGDIARESLIMAGTAGTGSALVQGGRAAYATGQLGRFVAVRGAGAAIGATKGVAQTYLASDGEAEIGDYASAAFFNGLGGAASPTSAVTSAAGSLGAYEATLLATGDKQAALKAMAVGDIVGNMAGGFKDTYSATRANGHNAATALRAGVNAVGFDAAVMAGGGVIAAATGEDWLTGAQVASQGAGLVRSSWGLFVTSCFAAGTPLLTPTGARPIEQFQVGDVLLSRPECDPERPAEAKVVEEVFVRLGRIMNLHVGGQVIRTTAEHPFWVKGKGWIPAGELQVGDLLSSHDGQWVAVEEVFDTGEYETVYNLRVADFHTYFVGGEEWGFSVWAHNAYVLPTTATQVKRLPNGGPANPALANATLYKANAAGTLTNYAEFNSQGLQTKRVDLTGKAHGGVPTPHVIDMSHNQDPATGNWFAQPSRRARPADPTTEVP